jgi:hypothetical protein
MKQHHVPRLHGVMAEFDSPTQILAAAHQVRNAGYRHVEAYSPYPIEELWEALGHHRSWVPWLVLVGGVSGAVLGFALCYWVSAIAYPVNIGGRPFNSWPAFIPVTFECTILLASLSAVMGMLALNGLPTPHHPVFNVERFVHASRDRYYLCIDARDPKFDHNVTRAFLHNLRPIEVTDVQY